MWAQRVERLSSDELRQSVIGIIVIYGSRSDQFVLHEHGRRDRALIQDIETDSNQILAIPFGKVCNRTNEASSRLTQLRAPLRRSVLSHDCAVLCPSRF